MDQMYDSDASDQESAPAARQTANPTSDDDDDASSTEYVYIDPVDDPTDADDDVPSSAADSVAASVSISVPHVLDDSLPDTPLQTRADQLVSRYLRRATQPATPDVQKPAARQSRLVSVIETIAVDSCDSSDSGQATVGTGQSTTDGSSFQLSQSTTTTPGRPLRRSVRLKSINDTDARSRSNTPESHRSGRSTATAATGVATGSTDELTIDEVCVSSSSQDSNQPQLATSSRRPSSTHSNCTTSSSLSATDHMKRRLQHSSRLQRMSVDMANLSVSSASTTAATTAASTRTPSTPHRRRERLVSSQTLSDDTASTAGPSPRKQRARTPSAKCLEAFNLDELHLSTPRRMTRTQTPAKRNDENVAVNGGAADERTPPKKRVQMALDVEMCSDHTDETGGEATMTEQIGRSTMLYDDEADVAGQQMFAFRTPKKRNGMAQLAALAPRTPQTPKTPKRRPTVTADVGPQTPKTPRNGAAAKALATKTPSRLRSVLKRELAKFQMPETSGSDFSADDSDEYKPGASEDSDDDGVADDADDKNASDASSSSPDAPKANQKKRYVPPVVPKTPTTRTSKTRRGQQDFVPECEDYFTHHTNKKATTSDRTLDRMKTPRLPHDDLFKLLAATALSAVHEQAVTDMHQEHRQHFAKWLFVLNEGFNLLLHGLGSKRNLLQQFHQDVLADQTVLVVNGFFPSLTIKDVLDSIAVDILELTTLSRNLHEVIDAISEELSDRRPDQHVFVIMHNIDGVMLRNHKAQLLLSRLAKIGQIHLIASMDHINAPLLWDHIKLSNFNFSWWDCTTMLPYTEETAFENSMLVNNSGGLALSSMKNVFLSLTQNSRGIFLVIVRNQLKHKGNANFQGMPFKELYSRCREDFLVSSDVALRSQLTEFIDHHLVKMRRTADGIENLVIPLDGGLLEQFLELQENND